MPFSLNEGTCQTAAFITNAKVFPLLLYHEANSTHTNIFYSAFVHYYKHTSPNKNGV